MINKLGNNSVSNQYLNLQDGNKRVPKEQGSVIDRANEIKALIQSGEYKIDIKNSSKALAKALLGE